MRVLDLFSGIGGFSLGLERAGMRTVAFCEIDPFCRRVLARHWPDVPVWGDIRTLTPEWVISYANSGRQLEPINASVCGARMGQKQSARHCGIDLICGGFPCQDISVAGKGAGIEGARSGLWSEYARVIGEVRPRYVIVENVAALLGRGIERVLGDLAALGFDAEWHCIPASAVGAPHRRDRVWIVAYTAGEGANGHSCGTQAQYSMLGNGGSGVADTHGSVMERQWLASRISEERDSFSGSSWWFTEPDVGRVAHGVPARVDRLRSLGNAVVPQIPEIIGRAILRHAGQD